MGPKITPLYLIWTLFHECPIREDEPGDDLIQLDRHLRPLQTLSDCAITDRIHNGVCIDRDRNARFDDLASITGFSVEEVTTGFGGLELLQDACLGCPANARLDPDSENHFQFAGCCGIIQSRYPGHELFDEWNLALRNDPKFKSTTDIPIYSFWANGNLNANQLQWLDGLLAESAETRSNHSEIQLFQKAVKIGLTGASQLLLQAVPEGTVDERNWRIPRHCSRCKINAEEWNGRCGNCGCSEPTHPPRKRLLRGKRPYWNLLRFMSESAARELVDSYSDLRSDQ